MIDTAEKLAGVLVPVFAMRREGDLGIGDTQAVKETIDFCVRNNAAVLQVLPINETGGDNSPYNAISSVALDPVLCTVEPHLVPGLTEERFTQIARDDILSRIRQGAVQYHLVKQLKLDLLRSGYDYFCQNEKFAGERQKFEEFKRQQSSWLPQYALFRTLVAINNNNAAWTQWHERQRSPQAAEQWIAEQPNASELQQTRDFFAYVQWVAFAQWQDVRQHADRRKVRLMGDIPFGVSRYSADVWANQGLFDLQWSGGAPPERWFQGDPFTAKWGQNWGLPLYNWQAHKEENFAWWRQRVQKCIEFFHYFRIDHVLGFFRIYAFPWEPERNGEFLPLTDEEAKKRTGGRLPRFSPRSDEEPEDAKKNADEGAALLEMILDAAGDAGVVAEDLGGTVPEYVRPLLQKLKIPGFTIPYWEHPKGDYHELKKKEELPIISLATWATHDHQPLVLYYEGLVKRWHGPNGEQAWKEVQPLMRFLQLDENNPPKTYTPELHKAFMQALLETPCWLAIFMITDLLATSERFNEPGTHGESNWSRRLDHSLSWYEKTEPFNERISEFARLVKETRRLPHAWQVGTIR
jgi:4-alpha-glucanotransferase